MMKTLSQNDEYSRYTAAVEDRTLKIRQKGFLLCLDTRPSYLYRHIANLFSVKCEQYDIPLKFSMLSRTEELHETPDDEFFHQNAMRHRGRFITPLAENIFPQIQDEALHLILISDEVPYDWKDQAEFISNKFVSSNVLIIQDMENRTLSDIENGLIDALFQPRAITVSMRFEEGLPHQLPDGFSVCLQDNQFVMEKNEKTFKIDIPLKTFGASGESRIHLLLNQTPAAEIKIKNKDPESFRFERELSSNDAGIFFQAVESYCSGNRNHFCPLCGCEHEFVKALHCRNQSCGFRLFSDESLVFKEIEESTDENTKFILFKVGKKRVYWRRSNSGLIFLNRKQALYAVNNSFFMLEIAKSLKMTEFDILHESLYCFRPKNLLALKLSEAENEI